MIGVRGKGQGMNEGEMQLARVSDVIDAPIATIWDVLTDFANPQRLAPTIERCTATGSGVGAVRHVHSSRGLTIHERLLECDRAAGRFRYEVLDTGDMPFAHVTRYECTVTLVPRPDGATAIEWASVGAIDGRLEPIADFLDGLYVRANERIRAIVAA